MGFKSLMYSILLSELKFKLRKKLVAILVGALVFGEIKFAL